MERIPQIKDVMTPFPHSIDYGATIQEARGMMTEHCIRHLPIKKGGDLVGVITDRDVKLLLDPEANLQPPGDMVVGDLCVTEAYAVELTEPLDKVLLTMAERRFGSAMVVKDGRLAGIFTATDACRCFAEHLRDEHTPPDDDVA